MSLLYAEVLWSNKLITSHMLHELSRVIHFTPSAMCLEAS